MKVDLLRQLDEWGNHLEAGIEHVSADEVVERIPQLGDAPELPSNRPVWRGFVRYAGVAAILIVLLGAMIRLGTRETVSEFSSVGGGDLGGGATATTRVRAATSTTVAGTFAPNTTAAAATTLAPEPPATTSAPSLTTTIPPAGNNPANLGRAVIFVGDLAIDTRDVSGAVTQARAIVESRGGYVFGQELGGSATVMSLKIPAEFFQDTLDRLSELGTVTNARVSSEDVTERIVDLESQIKTAETSVARLQELLAGAESINTIARLESELLDRETSLERLRGQLRTLQDQVALSTIVVTIREFVPTPDVRFSVSVHAADNPSSEECFTDEGPFPRRGESYVVCIDITNVGNLELTDIEIDGPIEIVSGLTSVDGNRIDVLPAGERYVLWTTATAAETLRTEIQVRAIPLDETGEALIERIVDRRRSLNVVVDPEPELLAEPDDGGLPSLGESLSAGWTVVTTGLNVVAVAMAFVLPLLWIPVLGVAIYWWRRRRAPQ